VGGDFKFHFKGRNVPTASADSILEAIDEETVAILVGPEGITGVKPAISPGDGGRLRCLVVAWFMAQGASVRMINSPISPCATSQSILSTRRTSMPARGLPHVAVTAGFGSATRGHGTSDILKSVCTVRPLRLPKAIPSTLRGMMVTYLSGLPCSRRCHFTEMGD
jgi:hypothetical protein